MDEFIDSIAYVLPAIVTGFVAFYMFNSFLQQQNHQQKLAVLADKKKETLPIKLQAYERMLLFCDRINPMKLLIRVTPISENVDDYEQLLIANINQEFEHNFVQQIYISDECWTAITACKRAIVSKIKKMAASADTAKSLRENILIEYSNNTSPTETAIEFIKSDVRKLL